MNCFCIALDPIIDINGKIFRFPDIFFYKASVILLIIEVVVSVKGEGVWVLDQQILDFVAGLLEHR